VQLVSAEGGSPQSAAQLQESSSAPQLSFGQSGRSWHRPPTQLCPAGHGQSSQQQLLVSPHSQLPSSQVGSQSAEQVLQVSPQLGWHVPLPQSSTHWLPWQCSQLGQAQSDGQVPQFSPQLGWHVPLPQSSTHWLPSQCSQFGHGQSDGQLPQFSPQLGWHVPLPQSSTHWLPSQCSQFGHGQSDGQLPQFSPQLQMPSPHLSRL
jgi:hypothetical protein